MKILNILIVFILIMLTSCKPKQVFVDKLVYDTIIQSKTVTVTLPATQQISIKNPCDSLGNLKPITFFQDNGKSRIEIFTKNNQLIMKSTVKPDTSSVKDTYQSKTDTQKEVIVKTVTPKWAYQLLIYSIIVTALLLWRLGIFKLIL